MFEPVCSEARLEIEMDLAFGTDNAQRLAELRDTVRRYQDRYGELDGMADIDKANSALASRRRRFEHLATERQRIQKEMRSAASEVARIERWMEFCLQDVVTRTREKHAEGWSPTPVLGYRLWAVGAQCLHGVKMAWSSRKMSATCLSRGDQGEIPHTDGRCGRLGCGVYAAKSVEPLYREFDVAGIGDVALGLVALTGKVVEHDSGYRAAEAEVIALGACFGDHLLLTADPHLIDAVIADPTLIKNQPRIEVDRQRLLEMETFVEIEARRARQWISGTSSE